MEDSHPLLEWGFLTNVLCSGVTDEAAGGRLGGGMEVSKGG